MGKHETMLGSNNLATWSMAATSLMQSLTRLALHLRCEGSVRVLFRDGASSRSYRALLHRRSHNLDQKSSALSHFEVIRLQIQAHTSDLVAFAAECRIIAGLSLVTGGRGRAPAQGAAPAGRDPDLHHARR